MIRCGKTAQTAISIMSLLAERYDDGETRLSSPEISRLRGQPTTLVAKLLTLLSSAGLVLGTRGPGGGYWLARRPEDIRLQEIVEVFEREQDKILCPFGPNWCGNNEPCPMHDSLAEMDRQWNSYLRETHLGIFVRSAVATVPALPASPGAQVKARPAAAQVKVPRRR